MDFVYDDELDYEEDDFEDESTKNGSQNNCHAVDKVYDVNKESDTAEFDGQFLQIDFTEEDENLTSREVPLETISCEKHNTEKEDKVEADERIETSKRQNIFSEKEHVLRNRNNGRVNDDDDDDDDCIGRTVKKVERDTRLTHLGRPLEFKEKSKTPVAPNVGKIPRKSSCYNQVLGLKQDFYPDRKSPFKLANLNKKQLGQNLQRKRNANKTFSNYFGLTFNSESSKFPTQDRKISSGDIQHKKFKPHLQDTNVSNISMPDKNVNIITGINQKSCFDEFQVSGVKRRDHFDQKTNSIVTIQSGNRFPSALYSLPEDEKERLRLKKEARLKRFIHDERVAGERELTEINEIDSNSEGTSRDGLRIPEGEKFTSDDFFILNEPQNKKSISDNDRDCLRKVKPDINKELLLKKRNPFDKNLEISNYNPIQSQIKQRCEKSEAKEECLKNKVLTSVMVKQVLLEEGRRKEEEEEEEEEAFSIGRGFYVVKYGVGSPVKFVRTVSKSFDELLLKPGLR